MRRTLRSAVLALTLTGLVAGPAAEAQGIPGLGRLRDAVQGAFGGDTNRGPDDRDDRGYGDDRNGRPKHNENAYCAGGGAAGGTAGAALFKRNRVLGAIVGGIGGCLIAKAVAHELNSREQAELARRTEAVFDEGEAQTSYYSADQHKRVTITRQPEYADRRDVEVETLRDVRAPDSGDFVVVGRTQYARTPVKLRAEARDGAAQIGSYRAGAAVFVMGRSRDGRWNSVGHHGVLVGYVPAASLGSRAATPARQAPKTVAAAKSSAPQLDSGRTVEEQPKAKIRIAADTSCAKAQQQVGGATGLVTGCRSPNGGWNVI